MIKGIYLFILLGLNTPVDSTDQKTKDTYYMYCSLCHGPQMEGGRASALIKDKWKYGGDRQSINKSIREGIPNTEMIRWEGILPAERIEKLTDYILKSQRENLNFANIN